MPDPIIQSAVQTVGAGVSATPDTALPSGAPSADVVQRFEDAMQSNGGASNPNMAADMPHEVVYIQPAQSTPTLGDAILNSLDQAKGSYDAKVDQLNKTLETVGDNMSMQDMMRLQFDLMQVGLQQDLTSKVADKVSQGVQTMFKNQ